MKSWVGEEEPKAV